MAIFTRFECPRCQHVFVTEGADDAFSDCPKCQSMALAIGEATGGVLTGPAPVLPALVSDVGAPVVAASQQAFAGREVADEPGGRGGVFTQLLESTDPLSAQVDVTGDNLRIPATLDDMPATSDEIEEE